MKLAIGVVVAAIVFLSAGCDKKDQDAALDQGRFAMSKAADFASGAWKSACDQAHSLSADSGKSAIESAKAQLEGVRKKMSGIKAPTSLDSLKLDSVKEEIARLQAALTIKNLKAQLDERVEIAKKLKDNAEKSYDDVKGKLEHADAEYQDLQKKLSDAQTAYDGASEKIKETTQKLQHS
jgi:chromosome segregation ATPase